MAASISATKKRQRGVGDVGGVPQQASKLGRFDVSKRKSVALPESEMSYEEWVETPRPVTASVEPFSIGLPPKDKLAVRPEMLPDVKFPALQQAVSARVATLIDALMSHCTAPYRVTGSTAGVREIDTCCHQRHNRCGGADCSVL